MARAKGKHGASRRARQAPEQSDILARVISEFGARRFREAADRSRALLQGEPDNIEAQLYLGLAMKELGQLDGARQYLARVAAARPDDAMVHENLALVLAQLNRREEALVAFHRAIGIAPRRASAWGNVGNLEMMMGRLEAARISLSRAIELNPGLGPVHLNLCWVLRRVGDFPGAIAAGRRAVELMPGNLHAYSHLALALLANDECALALEVCDAALRLNPRNTNALAYKPGALIGLGRSAEAKSLVDFERLLWQGELEADDLAEFNAALVDHVLALPTRAFDDTQTIDLMVNPQGPVLRLERILTETIKRYVASLPHDPSHPFLAVRPRQWKLDAWATRLRSMEHQEHHFHQHGWVSGVYYAKLPKLVGSPEAGLAGCIEFCRFPSYSGQRAESDFVAIKPTEGMFVVFPSYFYHRIIPFESPEIRVSIAFNAMLTA